MDVLSNLMGAMVRPAGLWPNIINTFESGVGSYLLAVVLITLILRVILMPFDFVNKRLTKNFFVAKLLNNRIYWRYYETRPTTITKAHCFYY